MAMNLKHYLLDSASSILFWTTIVYLMTKFYFKWGDDIVIPATISSAVINISFGGLYGWLLDKWRKALGYAETGEYKRELQK